MSLIGLYKKADYGKEIQILSNKILDKVMGLSKNFIRFDEIIADVSNDSEFTEDEINEIKQIIDDCYRSILYVSIGIYDMPGVGSIPINIWDEVGIDIKPILQAAGKYSSRSSSSTLTQSTSASLNSSSSSSV